MATLTCLFLLLFFFSVGRLVELKIVFLVYFILLQFIDLKICLILLMKLAFYLSTIYIKVAQLFSFFISKNEYFFSENTY